MICTKEHDGDAKANNVLRAGRMMHKAARSSILLNEKKKIILLGAPAQLAHGRRLALSPSATGDCKLK
jgi:hypothetical protein